MVDDIEARRPLPALLDEILGDAGRTPLPGAAPVVALSPDDEPDDVAAVRRLARVAVALERRGTAHGTWVALPPALEPSARLPRPSLLRKRWREARPFVLAGAVADELPLLRNEVHAGLRRGAKCAEPGGLRGLLTGALGGRGARFAVAGESDVRFDPERDVARVDVRDDREGFDDLWAKVGRLSTHPDDASLRLRFAFGVERDDDASDDEPRHLAVAALARAVLPELALVARDTELLRRVGAAADAPLYATGAIAYWNAPGGGALFHHDAFREDDADGQRGVLFVQLAGRTAWLALSSADLTRRIAEFLADESEPEWVALAALADDPAAARAELALPGCGRFGPVVDGWPAFTAFLADSGHAAVLEPGDAIVLPNNGLANTALHSVFCASPGPTYAVSVGLRRDRRAARRLRGQKKAGPIRRSDPAPRSDPRP